MVATTDMIADFDKSVTEHGTTILVKFYTASGTVFGGTGSEYDDDVYSTLWSQSGNNVSGVAMIQPLNRDTAGNEYKMVEQGILKFDDRKIFITGSLIDPMPSDSKVRFTIGANTWALLPEGLRPWDISGVTIYWSGFVRQFID